MMDSLQLLKIKKTGFVDTTGSVVIAAEWDKAERFSDGLSLVYSGGKYGYIDTTGTMVIKPAYTYAYGFHDGAAIVKTGTYKNKDEAYGLIDKSGKIIAQTKYEEIKYLFSSNGVGYFVAEEKVGSGWNVSWKRSIFDATGRLVGGQSWDYVSGSDKESLSVKTSDGNYKHLNVDDGTLSETTRNNFYKEGAYISYKDENGLYGYTDVDEKIVIPAQWAEVQWLFDGEFASVGAGNQYTSIRKYGAINRNGDLVVPCEYDENVSFVDGQALVKKDGYWFIIDTEGNIVF